MERTGPLYFRKTSQVIRVGKFRNGSKFYKKFEPTTFAHLTLSLRHCLPPRRRNLSFRCLKINHNDTYRTISIGLTTVILHGGYEWALWQLC